MTMRGRNRFAASLAATLSAGVLLAGCASGGGSSGSSSFFDKLGFGSSPKTGPTTTQTSSNPDQQDDFDCPPIEVRQGASTLTVGAKAGADATAADLRYQGSIVRTARECPLRAGIVNLKVGIEGRIVLGPVGGPGQLDVPLRMAVVHEGPEPKTIATKLYRVPVTIPPGAGNVTFTQIVDDLTFPMPKPAGLIDEYVIYVGFDNAVPAEPKVRKPQKPAPKRRSG